jgi:tetratricopeptide (TPR) repeat protein
MAKRKNPTEFDDLADSFFAAGEGGDFGWADEESPVEEAEDKAAEEQARKEREEAERKAVEDKARREREEAERKAAEEQARKEREEAERRAAEARAAEERARKEREEAERRAAEDKARREREEAEREAAEARAAEERARKEREESIAADWFEDDGWLSDDGDGAEEQARREREEAERRAAEERARKDREEAERKAAEARTAEERARREREEAERRAAEDKARREREEAERRAAEARAAEERARREREEAERRAAEERARKDREESIAADWFEDDKWLSDEEGSPEADPASFIDDRPAPGQVIEPPRISMPAPDKVQVAEDELEDPIEEEPDEEPPVRTEPASIVLPISPDGEITEDPTEATEDDPLGELEPVIDLSPSTAAPTLDDLSPARSPTRSDGAEAETWREMVQQLSSEAGDLPAAQLEIARITRRRLGDTAAAIEAARSAMTADEAGPAAGLRELAVLYAQSGDFKALLATLEELSGAEEDGAAAEVLQDAALLALNQLRERDTATRLLERALERQPDDYLSLTLLADIYRQNQRWEPLTEVLERLAALTDGPPAADLLIERGGILEHHMGETDAALDAYRAAQQADPSSATAFLALERVLSGAAEWTALAELYSEEASRTAGADRAFWRFRVATVYRTQLFDIERASTAYQQALAEGAGPEVAHAYQAFLAENGRWAELAEALEMESSKVHIEQQPEVLYRLARLKEEQLGDLDGALVYYRRVAREPAAAPAAEAVARILQDKKEWSTLLSFWEERIKLLEEPNLQVTLEYRMGEICEGPLDDQENARQHFERILGIAPGYLPALDGLERVYTRLEAWEQLAAVYEQRAILSGDDPAIALQLHRAAAVCEFRLNDLARAKEFYSRALDYVPHFPPSLDAYVRVLEAEDNWAGLAQALRSAAASTPDSNEVVSFYYRAGRVFADKVEDAESAIDCLRRCLALSPGFLPARQLLKELTRARGDWAELLELQVGDAAALDDLDRRGWQLLAAAAVAERIEDKDPEYLARKILEVDPAHPGAMAFLETRLHQRGDRIGLVELYRQAAGEIADDDGRARLAAVLTALLKDAGDGMGAVQAAGEVVIADEAEGRPLLAIARICEGLGYWEVAQQALDAVGDRLGVARLQERQLDSPEEARENYSLVLEEDPENIAAASALQRLSQTAGDRRALASAHAALAGLAATDAVKIVHATLAGHLFEANEDPEKSAEFFRQAFELRSVRGKAFEGLRRLYTAASDGAGLLAIYQAIGEGDSLQLAADMMEAGAASEAVALLKARAADLPTLLWLELAQGAAGDWRGAVETLKARQALLKAPEHIAAANDRLRAILAEKLADTDEAWDLYRHLHEQDPDDAEVLEALAGIAAARGEVELGIQYLTGLARVARSAADSARYDRRVARIHEDRGDLEAARESYLKALNHEPEDREALAGLHRIAETGEDWKALAGVLAREASLATGEEQVGLYAKIARVWEDRIQDPAVAADCWRKVLEYSPEDVEALEHLVELTAVAGDWTGFVEFGARLAQHIDGAPQTALLRRVGQAYLDHLHREEEAIQCFDLASRGPAPDLEAARALEQLRMARGEYTLVVEALRRQARAQEGEEGVATLLRAARLYRDNLHDREKAAALFQEILDADPENDEALNFLADFRFRAGEYAAAIELFERLEARADGWDLDDFDVQVEISLFYYHYALALNVTGRGEEALAKLEESLGLNPNHIPSLEAIGPLYMDGEQWKQAERVYRQLVQLIGGTAQAEQLAAIYSQLGLVEYALAKLEKAKKRFNKALELQPNNVPALKGMARVLEDQKDWNTLLNVFNNIIYYAQSRADVVNAYLMKGMILDVHMKLAEKAGQHYRKALAFGPGQAVALLRLAELSLRERRWDEARATADKALELDLKPAERAALLLARASGASGAGDEPGAAADLKAAAAVDEVAGGVGELSPGDTDGLRKLLRERALAMGV